MVFLFGFGSRLLHVQVKARKKLVIPELESLRGGVYMDGWPARCDDRIDKSLVYVLVVLSCVRPVILFRVMEINSLVFVYFES